MSQQHWTKYARDHTKTSSNTKSKHKSPTTPAAAAVARARSLGSILSGPDLGDLPAFVQGLDAMTGPKQRLVPWEALMVAAFNAGDKVEVERLWTEEVYSDVIGQFVGDSGELRGGSRRDVYLLMFVRLAATTVSKGAECGMKMKCFGGG